MALLFASIARLPVAAARGAPDDDGPSGVRVTTTSTVERISLGGLRGPVELSVDALMRTIRLKPTKDQPSALLGKLAGRLGTLCGKAALRDGAVELTCRNRRFDAALVKVGNVPYLDINELRGLPWRTGVDRAPSYFLDPWRVGVGQSCPGRSGAARGECQLKQGRLFQAAAAFRDGLSTSHRQMASLRLGDLALLTGDPVTAIGWYRRVGSWGVFGQFAAGRLCELEGSCLGSTEDVRRVFDPRGMPEPMRAETVMHAARAEAYLGRMRSSVKIMTDQIKSHGVASLCREDAEMLCRRLLLLAMREVVSPTVEEQPVAAPAVKASAPTGAGGAAGRIATAKAAVARAEAAAKGAAATRGKAAAAAKAAVAGAVDAVAPVDDEDTEETDADDDADAATAISDTDHMTNILQVFFALPSWDKGPLAIDLAQAAADVALRLGAPSFAGNLLVSAVREVPDRRLSEHLLLAVEAFLRAGDVVRARVVADYAEMRLGPKGRAGERWRAAMKTIVAGEDEEEISSELRAEIEKEIAASLAGLRDARGVLEKARTLERSVKEAAGGKSKAKRGTSPTAAAPAGPVASGGRE